MKRSLTVALLAAALQGAAGRGAGASTNYAGVRAGANAATLTGEDASQIEGVKRPVVGVALMFTLMKFIAFQPEFLFSHKGASGEASFSPSVRGVQSVSGIVDLTYFEIPLLLKFMFANSSRIDPYVVAGPSVAANISADADVDVRRSSGTETLDENVENVATDGDLGMVLGGGLDVLVRSTLVELDARYIRGLIGVVEAGAVDLKNSTWSITLGVLFRFGD